MRKLNYTVFLVLILVFMTPFALLAKGDSEEAAVVQSGDRTVTVEENWSFSWRFTDQEIEFTVIAPTTGWVAIGFNPSRMMKDADYKLAYVEGTTLYARDDWGTGNTSHGPDEKEGGTQDIRPIEGAESNGVTQVVFAIPRNSGDQFDTVFTPGETYKVLLAYGANNADNFTGMHRKRESIEVVLD